MFNAANFVFIGFLVFGGRPQPHGWPFVRGLNIDNKADFIWHG
jgi:hypothetical protein